MSYNKPIIDFYEKKINHENLFSIPMAQYQTTNTDEINKEFFQILNGFIDAIIISSGSLGNNKGVVIDPRFERKFDIPMLTEKDIEAIKIGLNEKISHVAASFMRSGETVKAVRNISKNK